MNARFRIMLGVALTLAGLVAVGYFIALFAWQITSLFQAKPWVALPASLLFTEHSFAFVPRLPWAAPEALGWILATVHVGLVFAIPGLAVMAYGVLTTLRQLALINALKKREEDRLRRLSDYRRGELHTEPFDGRREPYIGPVEMPENAKRRVA
jgi:hypothetical protein